MCTLILAPFIFNDCTNNYSDSDKNFSYLLSSLLSNIYSFHQRDAAIQFDSCLIRSSFRANANELVMNCRIKGHKMHI